MCADEVYSGWGLSAIICSFLVELADIQYISTRSDANSIASERHIVVPKQTVPAEYFNGEQWHIRVHQGNENGWQNTTWLQVPIADVQHKEANAVTFSGDTDAEVGKLRWPYHAARLTGFEACQSGAQSMR